MNPPIAALLFDVDGTLIDSWRVGAERVEACHAEMCRHYEALHPTHAEGRSPES